MDLCESSNRCEGLSVSGATPKEDPAAGFSQIGVEGLISRPAETMNREGR
jgi:hypothetical protein